MTITTILKDFMNKTGFCMLDFNLSLQVKVWPISRVNKFSKCNKFI